jgi:ABC-type sulfate/molybdate transport systems ATPase subunit
LDQQAMQRVEDIVVKCCQEGMAVLLVTHDHRQAERVGTHVLRMVDGSIVHPVGCVS